jgi:hypothetical protein
VERDDAGPDIDRAVWSLPVTAPGYLDERQDHLAAVLTLAQAAALSPHYRAIRVSHVEGLTVFLLART